MTKHLIFTTAFLFLAYFASAQTFNYDVRGSGGTTEVISEPQTAAIDDSEFPYRTQTIGGWGNRPKMRKGEIVGNNPGSFLHKNFETLFPTGVMIGSEDSDLYLSFSDAQAITDFLPSGGTARPLESSASDPTGKEIKNTLASQVLALTISVKLGQGGLMGYADLGKAEIVDENNMTVQQALSLGNKILAGEAGAGVGNHTPSSINNIISQINECFVDGENPGTGYVARKF